jgi:kynureninase
MSTTVTISSRADCALLDARDPLAVLRDRFELPEGVIYLDGNSLGARPRAALARAHEVVAMEWGQDLIRSWNKAGWFELPKRLGDRLAPRRSGGDRHHLAEPVQGAGGGARDPAPARSGT